MEARSLMVAPTLLVRCAGKPGRQRPLTPTRHAHCSTHPDHRRPAQHGRVRAPALRIAPSSALPYLNWVGSVLLVASAYVDHQWGFLMLEAGWVAVTGYAILRRITARQTRT